MRIKLMRLLTLLLLPASPASAATLALPIALKPAASTPLTSSVKG